jgi:hypothetical protein
MGGALFRLMDIGLVREECRLLRRYILSIL